MSKRSLVGVLVGGVTNIVTANVLNLPIGIHVILTTGDLEMPPSVRKADYLDWLHAHPAVFAISLAIWAFSSVLGGFVAARIAKENEIAAGALSSWACIALAVNALVHGISGQPIWQFLLWVPGSPLLSALGGYVAQRTIRRRELTP
ncbi:MAG: hypothetical protein ABSD52_03130 [Candidatus Cybelea sp.]|jgi:hypothetical protein